MDRSSLEKALSVAQHDVTIGEKHLVDLRRHIAALKRDGCNARHATEVLMAFEVTHAGRVQRRDRLLAEMTLKQLASDRGSETNRDRPTVVAGQANAFS